MRKINFTPIFHFPGVFKVKSKGGITQCDIEADFQTKQLASHLQGFYTINGPTHGTKLQLDYQFYRNPKQTIKLEGLYIEKSSGYRHDMYGEITMQFTAYPVYDFYAVLKNIVSIPLLIPIRELRATGRCNWQVVVCLMMMSLWMTRGTFQLLFYK